MDRGVGAADLFTEPKSASLLVESQNSARAINGPYVVWTGAPDRNDRPASGRPVFWRRPICTVPVLNSLQPAGPNVAGPTAPYREERVPCYPRKARRPTRTIPVSVI